LDVDEREIDRLKAINRAVLMSKCFDKENFGYFIEAINNPNRKEAESVFRRACSKAKLTDKQTRWLWNYLQNYNKDLAWNMSSAMNGW